MEIAEKKTIEFLESNSELYSFFELSSELIFILDETSNIKFINKKGAKVLRYQKEEIIGTHFFNYVPKYNKVKVANKFKEINDIQSDLEFKVNLIPKIGIEQSFNFKVKSLKKNNEIIGIIGIGESIGKENLYKEKLKELNSKLTELKRLNIIEKDRTEQKISVLNELNNLKNKFISNVSHELRTPLASIIGFSETIANDKSLTIESVQELNEIILTESKRLTKFINDILEFSDLENGKQFLNRNNTDLIAILQKNIDAIKNNCKEKKITLSDNLTDSRITIYADEKKISKSIKYLLLNAVKFSKQSDRITLKVKELLKEVEIIISDTGVGISEENIPLLFDKFSKIYHKTNNLSGTGFSLIMVKQVIDLHKGLILVKSELNKGTSFIIRLPKYMTD